MHSVKALAREILVKSHFFFQKVACFHEKLNNIRMHEKETKETKIVGFEPGSNLRPSHASCTDALRLSANKQKTGVDNS